MRRFLTSRPRWLHAGWLLPLVLLALPNCILPAYEYVEEALAFDPGEPPQTGAVMCDIPVFEPFDPAKDCATDEELAAQTFKTRAHAAIGLAEGDIDSIALDFSEDSLSLCSGKPRKVKFHGSFPSGNTICLNCESQIGATKPYVDANAVCVAKCI